MIVTLRIKSLALAIAHAEGYFTNGSVPQRAHNPGDIKVPNWTGPRTGDEGIPILASDTVDEPLERAGGWWHLYHQLWLIDQSKSHVYTLDMTIEQMGAKWTDTQADDWARNVAGFLGVDVSTTLRQILGA